MPLKPLTVTQLNQYISKVFSRDPMLNSLVVKGDVTKVTYHNSGNIYFSISDGYSVINAIIIDRDCCDEGYSLNQANKINVGDSLVIMGRISLYSKTGTYSLIVNSFEKEGVGDLLKNFQLLKEKLSKEGLFLEKYKKSLPEYPGKIGIVTSETGAALRDIIKTIRNKNSSLDLVIFPVKVQGEDAAYNMAEMLNFINDRYDDLDYLILGRGGGSPEDLAPFNEEVLARSIFSSKIPIVSAVGHEIDYSISDFTADVRAETPTAAGELVPDLNYSRRELIKNIEKIKYSLDKKLEYSKVVLDNYYFKINSSMDKKISDLEYKLENLKAQISSFDFNKSLEKGFVLSFDKEGNQVRKSKDMKVGKEYKLRFYDGEVEVKVIK